MTTPLDFRTKTAQAAAVARGNQGPQSKTQETATLALGCFWGEDIYRQYWTDRGLIDMRVGYIGGSVDKPTYRNVCSGETGHAEAVRVVFDPSRISYAEMIEFFYRTHDPTTPNRQGADRGTQYRSAIFAENAEQLQTARDVTKEVQDLHYASKGETVVTEIVDNSQGQYTWYDAESEHQQYLQKNPNGYHCYTHQLQW